ncbi:MAG: hypothetical protein P4L83_02630 [Nevskia sp.]|nr:hypothetical protein [Nevskia sp.]
MERKRRRWWTWGLTVATVLVVLAATVSMTFQLVVDAMPGYRERLQDRLTQAVGHPVRIGSMALTWHRLRPNLDLLDVAVLDEQGKPLARLSRLRLGFGLSRLLTADWMPRSVEAVGLQLQADVDALGHWTLRGFGGGGGGGDGAALQHVSGLDRLRLRNCELLVHDPQLSREPLRVGVADASVSHAGARYTLAAKLQPPAELAVAAAANASFTGDAAHPDGWQGQWSLQVDGVHGWPWLAGTLGPGVRLALDGARLNLSGRVEGGRIAEVDAQAAAAAVAALRGNEVLTRVTRVRLEAAAWPEQNAWRSEVRRLEMTGARGAWAPARGNLHYAVTSTGIVLDAGADGLRLDDLAPWAALWKDLPASAGRLADLRGDVHELLVQYELAAYGAAPR